MVEWRGRWVHVVWGMAGFLMFLSGFLSENVVTMVIGSAMTFAATSTFLTSYVKSEHRVKRTSEVGFGIAALGIVVYGYVLTGSLVLGFMTFFIGVMFSIAFTLSYLLPKIRGK